MTKYHRWGLFLGLWMICTGLLMHVPDMASRKLERTHYERTYGSPIWLERENNIRRSTYFLECSKMPVIKGDIPHATCASEANNLYPDRNWKQVAIENLNKGS